ncbi:glycogen synthase GlgA [Candidatus Parabeggiatoa sp. HSG14]|uniref:glycogen synthase GlgA n=1 Tax=Candidatus Parabeggiatoa sp. HSG14 TaxID=3055593 RepID=UPI0025A7881B|nr:glycogen synthase GlgA [Thiotrichales bacterium HSG14]
MNGSKLRVLFVSSEAYPLVKTGGLADVSYALPNALRKLGVDVRLLLPGYPSVLEQLSLIEVHENIKLPPLQEPVRLLAGTMSDGITPVYVFQYPHLFEREGGPYQDNMGKDWSDNALRFGMLSKVAALFGSHSLLFKPQIIHCNDWQTGLIPAFLKFNPNPSVKIVMSIHNMAYQGIFSPEVVTLLGLPPESFSMFGLEYHGKVSFLKAGLYYSDWMTTVSPTYAKDIQITTYGYGLEGLLSQRKNQLNGILNGIDTEVWNPENDSCLKCHYSNNNLAGKTRNTQALRNKLKLASSKSAPLIGMISRLTEQKGIDLVIPIIPEIIKNGAQLVILGSGDKKLEENLLQLATLYPKRLSVTIGYDEELAHQIEAGANMFIMPSKFEPCGLNQMYSMCYGTIPIVRRTGGLADTVIDATPDNIEKKIATGFVFEKADSSELLSCVQRALQTFRDKTTWRRLQHNGMTRDFSWQKSAGQYVSLYHQLIKEKENAGKVLQ